MDEPRGPLPMDVRLGRVGGVQVGLNWTWLIVVSLITWSLASEVFPATNEGLGTAAYIAMALVAALLFFGSLLLHEPAGERSSHNPPDSLRADHPNE